MTARTTPLWHATHHLRRFPPLAGDRDADCAIVGAGIAGLTAAVLLARAGRRVIVVERDDVGGGETGHTTAHLTEAVDARYHALARDFGEDAARLVAASSRDAIDRIEAFTEETGHDCGFVRLPGYFYAEHRRDVEALADELDAARRAGCAVRWVDTVPLPFTVAGALCWDRQAQVHITAYLEALLYEAARHGVRIYEQTRVVGVHDGSPCQVETDRGMVRARDVFVAANVPVNNRVLLHTKLAASRSYAIAVESARTLDGLFWDTAHPYHYTRFAEVAGRRYLIVGGEDHRTGEPVDTDACFDRLAAYARERFEIGAERYRWSGQIIEPVDGLPYIGLNSASRHVYVATGFAGNGMTFGTLAAMIVSDLMLGRPNAYAALYDATRVKPLAAAYDYVTWNAPFPTHFLKDRLTSSNTADQPVESLRPGDGAIFRTAEGKIAVCRDRDGALHSCSAVCTHLGCDVAWNHAEQTWDCPCHGSRFSPDGRVINGPAVTDLPWRLVPVPAARR